MELRETLQILKKKGAALGAFNVSTLEHFKAVLGASEPRIPVILEMSPGEASFFGIQNLSSLVSYYRQELDRPIFLNLDHARDISDIEEALKSGFDMVHFDGSHLSWEENVLQTKKVVEMAKDYHALVEGEIDQAGGHSVVKAGGGLVVLTDPQEAAKFVAETGIDILACFFGNLHGVYNRELRLDFGHLDGLSSRLNCFISMHGGSGVRAADVRRAAKKDVVKMNVSTELRVAWAKAIRKSLVDDREEIVPYKILPPVIDAVQSVVADKIDLLGEYDY